MFSLPPLPYSYDALEPYIDAETMRIHHDKHHQAYVDNLNKALENHPDLAEKPLGWLIGNLRALSNLDSQTLTKIRNNAGGHFNHSLFWEIMTPANENLKFKISNLKLGTEIEKTFGTFEKFQELFTAAGIGRFGSGWAWLVSDKGKLSIMDSPNQDNPLMLTETATATVILGLDVWEHAYYLRYQNRRAEYIKAWWNVVNWQEADKRFNAAAD